uniref:Maturase K n=1 Tax=Schistosoma curassoni TaxID=6186 RepID=A0A183L6Y8_9TREM
LREIQNVNRLDIFLYNFARQLFVYRLVNYLLFDSNIPLHFRRPLHTIWHNRPRSKSYIYLSYLLFSNPIINYHDANISSNAFSYRFNLFLTNLFIRKGSIPVSESILTSENKKWSDRLSYDFKIL